MRALATKFFRFTVGICYLHRWVFVGCLLVTSAYTLLVVSSQFEFPREGYYRHGWPAVHTFRVSDLEFGDPWYSVPWRIYRDAQLFYFWLFLGDLATAFGLSYGMTMLIELIVPSHWKISSEDEAIANRRRLTVELREPVEVEEDAFE